MSVKVGAPICWDKNMYTYNCWKVIWEHVLTVILRSVQTHDLDNAFYQHSVWKCGRFTLAYFVRIYVSVYASAETVCMSGSTGMFANWLPSIMLSISPSPPGAFAVLYITKTIFNWNELADDLKCASQPVFPYRFPKFAQQVL